MDRSVRAGIRAASSCVTQRAKFTLKDTVHLMRRGRSGRRAGLRMAHQNFHPRSVVHIAFNVLIHYIQACATTPE